MNRLFDRATSKASKVIARRTLKGGATGRRLYYRLISEAFGREEAAVDSGIQAYNRTLGTGKELFTLRRNTHMIEKGLTMRPRRREFALAYIGATVHAYAGARAAVPSQLGEAEAQWMHAVLTEYFEATRASTSEKIIRLRGVFESVPPVTAAVEISSGPHHHQVEPSNITISDLRSLAMNRRSVRWFNDMPVDRSLVDAAVAIGMESPTACNRQPYRFEIFDDPASVAKVAEIPMGAAGYAEQITGIIVIIGDMSAFFDERDRHLIYIDSCLAAMGLIYGLETQGVASCCINWPDLPDRDKAMMRLLDLAPYERVVMLVAYGYADAEGLVPFSAKRNLDVVRRFRELDAA